MVSALAVLNDVSHHQRYRDFVAPQVAGTEGTSGWTRMLTASTPNGM
jgi:hypothetical protein